MADQLQQPVPVDQILKKLKTSQPAAATTLPDHIMTARPDAQPKQQAQPKPAVAKPTAPAAPTVKPVNDILAKLRTPQPVSVEDQVRSAAKQYGVDPELAWKVAHQESGFNPRAVSRAGARGVMQLMGATAARYGVNPNNVEENIAGGMRYLHDLIDRYDSTDKALAAYNWGEERVDEAIQKYGENWLAHAPEETQRYVGAITSTGYMDQRGASFTLPRIFGRRGMEPRIPYPEPEAQTPKTSGPFGRMIDSLRAIGSKAYQHSFWADEEGEMGRGILGRAGRERAQAWWEENVPWRNFNAATLAAFHDLVGLPGVAAVMTDPQGDLEAFQKAHPDWANDPELKNGPAASLGRRGGVAHARVPHRAPRRAGRAAAGSREGCDGSWSPMWHCHQRLRSRFRCRLRYGMEGSVRLRPRPCRPASACRRHRCGRQGRSPSHGGRRQGRRRARGAGGCWCGGPSGCR